MLRPRKPTWRKSQSSNGLPEPVRIFKRDLMFDTLPIGKTEVFPWKRPERRAKPRCRRTYRLLWEDRGMYGDKKYADSIKKELFDLRIVNVRISGTVRV